MTAHNDTYVKLRNALRDSRSDALNNHRSWDIADALDAIWSDISPLLEMRCDFDCDNCRE